MLNQRVRKPRRPFLVPSLLLGALASACQPPDPRRGGSGADGGSQDGGNGGSDGGGGTDGGGAGGAGGDGGGKRACSGGATFGGAGSPWKNPVVQCQWTRPGEWSITTPLVIDLDGDRLPEIVFSTGDTSADTSTLYAIRGGDCAEVWRMPAEIGPFGQIAAGDLGGDARPEIAGIDFTNRVVRVFSADGALLASSEPLAASFGLPGATPAGGVALADVDGMPPAEIVVGGVALRLEPGAAPRLDTVWSSGADNGAWGTLSLVADVDLDGKPEVVAGNRILEGSSGAVETPDGLSKRPPGYAAVAQIDRTTPEPEIVLVSSESKKGSVSIVHPVSGAILFGPYTTPTPAAGSFFGVGGGPTVADFDGDGEPEVGVAGPVDYRVYDTTCAGTPTPAGCAAPGVLWASRTKDTSSGGTSSSVFDFNCDGKAEVVYRDECWLRIYDGKTGEVKAAFVVTSGTSLEEPVIADVDGDGHAEIVVVSDEFQKIHKDLACPDKAEEHTGTPWTGYTRGVFVLRDPDDRWAPARPIWNQNTYHVTNVDLDGRIPAKEERSWERFNNYRQNVP